MIPFKPRDGQSAKLRPFDNVLDQDRQMPMSLGTRLIREAYI
jgi:hypothetical protein